MEVSSHNVLGTRVIDVHPFLSISDKVVVQAKRSPMKKRGSVSVEETLL